MYGSSVLIWFPAPAPFKLSALIGQTDSELEKNPVSLASLSPERQEAETAGHSSWSPTLLRRGHSGCCQPDAVPARPAHVLAALKCGPLGTHFCPQLSRLHAALLLLTLPLCSALLTLVGFHSSLRSLFHVTRAESPSAAPASQGFPLLSPRPLRIAVSFSHGRGFVWDEPVLPSWPSALMRLSLFPSVFPCLVNNKRLLER